MTFTPYDRPVRAAFVGLGRIYDLNVRAYVDNPDVEVVALVDPSEERRVQRQADWPEARTFASTAELSASGLEVDAVEALLPIPLHVEGVIELLESGWHVNLQKPLCNDLESARKMLEAADAADRVLRVMENYIFYEPLRKLKETVTSGVLGEVSGYHMKMVGSGLGGWDVPASSWEWQFQQMQHGRGILVFDDGWHKLATAIWLFGPIREVRAWVGSTEVLPEIKIDAPTTIAWEHDNGIRGVWDITLAPSMYLRSDYYTNDERWEVTGQRGLCPRQSMHRSWYPTTESRGIRRRRDALVPCSRRRLGQQLSRLRTPLAPMASRRRRSAALERARGGRCAPVRTGGLRQQRGRWHRRRSPIASQRPLRTRAAGVQSVFRDA